MSKQIVFKTVVGEQYPTTTYTIDSDESISRYSELQQIFRITHTNKNSSQITTQFENKSINFIMGKQNIDINTTYFTLEFNKKNVCQLCVLIRDKEKVPHKLSTTQTNQNWGPRVIATVEGYSGPGTENNHRIDNDGNIIHSTIFRPVDRNGNETGISLETFGPAVDKNGKPVKICVQAVELNSDTITINGKKYSNQTRLH